MLDTQYLSHSEAALADFAASAVRLAAACGCEAAIASVYEHSGITAQVRGGEIETISSDQQQGLSITVFDGQRKGSASTGELSAAAIDAAVRHASDLARFTGGDPDAGLADPADLAVAPMPIDLFRPSAADAATLAAMAMQIEAGALSAKGDIGIMSAGAASHDYRTATATSHGFAGAYSSSSHSAWCAATARAGDAMQGDSWGESERDFAALPGMREIGEHAAIRALGRLSQRPITTRTAPILFDSNIAAALLEPLVGGLTGNAQYQRASFLLDALGRRVMPEWLDLIEDPFVPLGMASRPFDADGVAGTRRWIVRDGIVEDYFLSAFSARKLQRRSTGNASGPHNLMLRSTRPDPDGGRDAMLSKLGTGLYLIGLSGQGVNLTTGDYSRAAYGYWVERGAIAYPVDQITIAGNLKDMLGGIVAVGTDQRRRGAIRTGSILIDSMRIAGR